MSPLPRKSFVAMSWRVAMSAVAVKAASVALGKRSCSADSASYSGRKLAPHCEMQWASSMTNIAGSSLSSWASIRSVISRSGDM